MLVDELRNIADDANNPPSSELIAKITSLCQENAKKGLYFLEYTASGKGLPDDVISYFRNQGMTISINHCEYDIHIYSFYWKKAN